MNVKSLRITNWSFKLCEDNLRAMEAPCMDPVWIGTVCDRTMRREVRAFHADGGYVTHLVNCGGKPDGDIVICIRGMAEAELLSPNAERALALDILDDRVRFPAASFDTYAVLSSRCGASSRPAPKQA